MLKVATLWSPRWVEKTSKKKTKCEKLCCSSHQFNDLTRFTTMVFSFCEMNICIQNYHGNFQYTLLCSVISPETRANANQSDVKLTETRATLNQRCKINRNSRHSQPIRCKINRNVRHSQPIRCKITRNSRHSQPIRWKINIQSRLGRRCFPAL